MMTLIAAAALAAQPPAAPAPAAPMTEHQMHMQMGDHAGHADHKGMDCCKHCCDDMDAKHDGHGAGEAAHSSK